MGGSHTTYLSIGTNLGERLQNLQEAIFLLGKDVGRIQKISSVYECRSWGFEADDFLNICLSLDTSLEPHALLQKILSIEELMGRVRTDDSGYQSRQIDIDILYHGAVILDEEALSVPHPKMQERKFVLQPLADIAPQFYHPILKKDTRNLLQECRDKGKVKKTEFVLFQTKDALFSAIQFISIEGNIGAGKTSFATKLASDFNAKLVLERFADNPFLPNFYQDQSRYAFPLEMSFLADRYQQFTDDTTQFDLFKSFMVSDYDIFKSLIFAQITLQKDEFELYRKIFNVMYKEVKKPRIYIYLYQTTERLLENIKQRGRDYEQGIDAEYLEKINRSYFDYIKGYPALNSLVIDISDLDFLARSQDYNVILTTIQNYALQQLQLT